MAVNYVQQQGSTYIGNLAADGTGTSGSGSSAPASPGGTTLIAGNNLNLGAVTETSNSFAGGKKARRTETSSTEVGSLIQTSGDLTLRAGNDLTAKAANVTSDGAIVAQAGRDLSISTGQSTYGMTYDAKSSKKGFLSKTTKTRHDEVSSTSAIASTFSGDSVTLLADRDIAVKGSNVVATRDSVRR